MATQSALEPWKFGTLLLLGSGTNWHDGQRRRQPIEYTAFISARSFCPFSYLRRNCFWRKRIIDIGGGVALSEVNSLINGNGNVSGSQEQAVPDYRVKITAQGLSQQWGRLLTQSPSFGQYTDASPSAGLGMGGRSFSPPTSPIRDDRSV